MSAVFFVILPLILLVAVGQIAAKTGQITHSEWDGIEKLSFKILLPALLFQATASSSLSLHDQGPYVLAIILAFAAAGILTLLLRPLGVPVGRPQISSLFQSVTRFNALIALPIADQLFPENGMIAVTIAMAFLIPSINIANISVLSALTSQKFSTAQMFRNLAKNPLIISCVIGLGVNFGQIQVPQFLSETLSMISQGALAVGLFCVGAGFRFKRLFHLNWKILWSLVFKTILAPAAAYGLSLLFGLGALETFCAVLIVATPTATNGYIIARQMDGDAELYAVILNWQLVISIFSLPLMIYLVDLP